MTALQQTIDIPASRLVRVSPEVPLGRCRIVFFPEPPVPAKADPEEPLPQVSRAQREEWENDPVIQELNKPLKLADPEEPLPRVTRAEREERRKRRKDDPVWQVLDKPLKLDWSWLPEGITPETLTHKDLREMRLRDKYGI